jgi:hypothetical protein
MDHAATSTIALMHLTCSDDMIHVGWKQPGLAVIRVIILGGCRAIADKGEIDTSACLLFLFCC